MMVLISLKTSTQLNMARNWRKVVTVYYGTMALMPFEQEQIVLERSARLILDPSRDD